MPHQKEQECSLGKGSPIIGSERYGTVPATVDLKVVEINANKHHKPIQKATKTTNMSKAINLVPAGAAGAFEDAPAPATSRAW